MEFIQLKQLPGFEISIAGIIRNITTKAIKSQYVSGTGYYMISVSKNNKTKPYRVHRLLANTYIPNPKNLPEINHKDGNKLNNDIRNLEWCTHAENMSHANKTGLLNNKGSRNGMAKLKEEDIPKIRELLKSGMSQYKIAVQFNISRSAIENIKVRGNWAHIK
jgi:hypothetical protein